MPGVLAAASVVPGTVLPYSLCTAYEEDGAFPLLVQSGYHDVTTERSLVTDGVNLPSRMRTWKLAKRLSAAQLTALLNFWEVTVQGGLHPFYFYDPFASGVSPVGSNYDATGSNIVGRYTVFFRGSWSHSIGLGRAAVPNLHLVQVE